MARATYRTCKVCRELHEMQTWPEACYGHFGEPPRQATYVRADGMDPIRSMVSGKMHDSKSAYYGEVRRAGCEIVGDDRGGFGKPPGYQAGDVAADIKRAVAELSQRS